MKQKGFATIFGLCLILIIALIVKGIQEAEANHAREVSNFQPEQALQNAAYSGIIEAAEFVRQNPDHLLYEEEQITIKKSVPVSNKTFKNGEQSVSINVEVWGERGKIYFYKKKMSNGKVKCTKIKEPQVGVYFMCRASIDNGFWGEKIFRRAYAYVLSEEQDGSFLDDTTIYFMELPTQYGNIVTRENN